MLHFSFTVLWVSSWSYRAISYQCLLEGWHLRDIDTLKNFWERILTHVKSELQMNKFFTPSEVEKCVFWFDIRWYNTWDMYVEAYNFGWFSVLCWEYSSVVEYSEGLEISTCLIIISSTRQSIEIMLVLFSKMLFFGYWVQKLHDKSKNRTEALCFLFGNESSGCWTVGRAVPRACLQWIGHVKPGLKMNTPKRGKLIFWVYHDI